jgi:hypothetical protein
MPKRLHHATFDNGGGLHRPRAGEPGHEGLTTGPKVLREHAQLRTEKGGFNSLWVHHHFLPPCVTTGKRGIL